MLHAIKAHTKLAIIAIRINGFFTLSPPYTSAKFIEIRDKLSMNFAKPITTI
jgi:hypothetical protein